MGQDDAMSLEDSATIGCLLPRGTPSSEVPARLAAHQTIRKARSEFVLTPVTVPAKRGLYRRWASLGHRLWFNPHLGPSAGDAGRYSWARFGQGRTGISTSRRISMLMILEPYGYARR
ncbi:hypothetical protein B0H15DRAFT_815810 [Mycena belliarum]|uniref:Uncharacterized protein n=1 Tax=Mycena belliarum TaxID=1033014 RepID=A0AAD6XUY5_9AGAR|nr:hypothetical protein B0H15DRAFT_815810 [Mycena belliae]